MKKSFFKGALFGALIVLLLMSLMGCLSGVYQKAVVDEETEKTLSYMNDLISQKYLYEDEIDRESMQDGILAGYIAALNEPYSVYYNEEQTQALLESLQGELCGLGVLLTMDMTTYHVIVVEVYEGTPADKAGMKAGDILTKIDGEEIVATTLDEVVSQLRGEKGTKVEVTVFREENAEEIICNVTRDHFTVPTVEHRMMDNQIGYIRLLEFDAVTTDQFVEAFETLEKDGMKSLVIDLRNNPGGNLDTVCQIADMLLPKGTIVSTKDKHGKEDVYKSDADTILDVPLVVLINGQSASASEILAGAIRDYELGTLVGTTSYGKGIVQEIYTLQNGDALKLTVSEYFTPNGENIHGVGVSPDVEVEYVEEDNQLEKAVEILLDEMG